MKVFLSHPMGGLDEEMIKNVRKEMTEFVNDILEDKPKIIDSYFSNVENIYFAAQNHSLDCLGFSIRLLADADIIVMGKGWEYSRGCKIEHECAILYDIQIIYM